MYDFLLVPARNKMYEGAAQAHFISAGTSKKSERFYLTWLIVGDVIHCITVAKGKMYGSKKYSFRTDLLHQKQYLLLPANKFFFLQL